MILHKFDKLQNLFMNKNEDKQNNAKHFLLHRVKLENCCTHFSDIFREIEEYLVEYIHLLKDIAHKLALLHINIILSWKN